jgi:protocatechuate 3,4-dioxygenase beta subunit
VAADTGEPLARAEVVLTGGGTAVRRAVSTDRQGRYEFEEVPAGRYTLQASKPPYVTRHFGQVRPRELGTPVIVADGQRLEQLDFSLQRGSVLTGRVTDEFGQPLVLAQVQAQRYGYTADGQQTLIAAGGASTDDRGQFRIFGLDPGAYFLSAGLSGVESIGAGARASDTADTYPMTFYPGTINPNEAQAITLAAGEETAVDLSLLAARLARITGAVVNSSGEAAAGVFVTLRSRTNSHLPISNGFDLAAGDGTFALSNVPPGEYVVQARSQPIPGRSVEYGSAPATVEAGDVTVRITTSPGATISGQLIFDGRSSKVGLPFPVRVLPVPVEPDRASLGLNDVNGVVADDGRFTITDATGEVFFVAAAPPGWTVRDVTLDGEDITYTPYDLSGKSTISGLRIVITDRLTKISGRVADEQGQPVNDYVVVMQPAGSMERGAPRFFIHVVRPDQDGRFRLEGAPPARYVATAVESLEDGRQFVPEFQESLRQSGREIEVSAGGSVEVSLELTRGR